MCKRGRDGVECSESLNEPFGRSGRHKAELLLPKSRSHNQARIGTSQRRRWWPFANRRPTARRDGVNIADRQVNPARRRRALRPYLDRLPRRCHNRELWVQAGVVHGNGAASHGPSRAIALQNHRRPRAAGARRWPTTRILARLRQGVVVWNAWRVHNAGRRVDLSRADLRAGVLAEANLPRRTSAGRPRRGEPRRGEPPRGEPPRGEPRVSAWG